MILKQGTKQHDARDCGAACLATILNCFGRKISLAESRQLVKTDISGTTVYGIVDGAKKQGLLAEAYSCESLSDLYQAIKGKEIEVPLVAHVIVDEMEHFIVIRRITKKHVYLFDPAKGNRIFSIEHFCNIWTGHIICFEKAEHFQEGNYKKGYYFKYIELLFKQKRILFEVVMASLIIVAISIVGALAYEVVIDDIVLKGHENSTEMNHEHNESIIWEAERIEKIGEKAAFISEEIVVFLSNVKYLFSTLIGLYLCQAVMQMMRGILLAKISRKINLALIKKYICKIYEVPLDFFDSMKAGEILSRFSDIEDIRAALSNVTLSIMLDMCSLIAGAGVMWMIHPKLFVLMLMVAFTYLFVVLVFIPIIEMINQKIMENNAKLTADIKESIDGIETIRVYNAGEGIAKRLYSKSQRYIESINKGLIVYSFQGTLVYLIESIGTILILCIGAKLVIMNQLTLGELMAFEALIGYVIVPIKSVMEMQPTIQRAIVAADRLNDILEINSEEVSIISDMGEENIQGDIYFNNIHFRYGNRPLVLNGITCRICMGENVAFVGESGCGKSTLVKMLLRINEPEEGAIYIGNKKLEDIALTSIRKRIVYVSQETFLLSDTIRNNLKIGNQTVSEEEILEICQKCELNKMIEELPDGLDTLIYENGRNLSGGQRQRIAIARALLTHPQILILDEATSQLDSRTEKSIYNMLLQDKSMTCIVIAHRLQIVSKCEKIGFLKKGKLIEYGSHKGLLHNKGPYSEMWEMEAKK